MRRYTPAEKEAFLTRLDKNGGDVAFTARQLNISERTLFRWKKERLPLPPPPLQKKKSPQPPQSVAKMDGGADRLRAIRDQLMTSASALAASLTGSLDDMTPVQRATALNQVLGSIAKLNAYLPPDESERPELRILYENARTGEISDTPPEPDDEDGFMGQSPFLRSYSDWP